MSLFDKLLLLFVEKAEKHSKFTVCVGIDNYITNSCNYETDQYVVVVLRPIVLVAKTLRNYAERYLYE